ncbi:MAG: amidohydrolase [Thermotogaceae bacterium]|nr:amidohydrolase [Thermotogaceae bacterium]
MLIKNILVIENAFSQPKKADILIENGIIKKVGNIEGVGIDLSGKVAFPAFYNTHTHAAMSLMRGVSDDDPLDVWLFEKVLPLEDSLNEEMVYYGTMVSMMEMARNGIAGFIDMYFFLDSVAEAVKDFGMRALITRGLVDENGEDNGRLKENLEFIERWHDFDGRISGGLGPHSPYLCSKGYLQKISAAAKEYNVPVHMHLYESAWERDKYDAKEILEFFKDVKLIIAHAVQFKENELEALSRENFFVSHNPSSNLKLGNGIAPVAEMLKKGVKVTVGTDGAASNNTLDILHEMRLAALIQKAKNPTNMKVEEVLNMTTKVAAEAFGLNAGEIKDGMLADIVIFDTSDISCLPVENIKSHIVHSRCKVFATMVAGRWIYYNGMFPTINESEILYKFKKLSQKLLKKEISEIHRSSI